MKKIILYPESYASQCSEILLYQEPKALHNVLWITLLIIVTCGIFVGFGKMDEVIHADGIVRPTVNVSCVKNIISGEIEDVFYKPGQFVNAGEKLLAIKADSIDAQKKSLSAQLNEVQDKISGILAIIDGFEKKLSRIECEIPASEARFSAFIAEKNVLEAKTRRMKLLYEEELSLPPSTTTKASVNECKFNYELSRLSEEEYSASFILELREEYDSLMVSKEEIIQNLAQVQVSLDNLVLCSPVSGYVQEISSLNAGDYIFTDQQVLNIIPPSDSSCKIELHIPAERMGKLKTGQRVKLRFPAFPYSEYRGVDGVISVIEPDSQSSQGGSLYFTAYADLKSLVLKNKKQVEFLIKPGFEVNARIVLDNQTLLYFLLKKLDLNC